MMIVVIVIYSCLHRYHHYYNTTDTSGGHDDDCCYSNNYTPVSTTTTTTTTLLTLQVAGVVCMVLGGWILIYRPTNKQLPLQEAGLRHSPPSFSVLCCVCPYPWRLAHTVISPVRFSECCDFFTPTFRIKFKLRETFFRRSMCTLQDKRSTLPLAETER